MSDSLTVPDLDSYREAWRGQRTTFVVHGESVGAETLDWLGRLVGTRSARFRDLLSTADHSWHRDERRYTVAGAVVGLGVPVGALVLWRLDVSAAAWIWFGIALLLGFAGTVAYSILDRHRVEYAWFRYRSGVTAFAIGRVGPEAAKFDAFIAGLERRIKAAGEA